MADQQKKWGEIQLSGEDGNAFMILGKCRKQMKRMGASPMEIDAFNKQATSGDYDHLLTVVGEWFEVN